MKSLYTAQYLYKFRDRDYGLRVCNAYMYIYMHGYICLYKYIYIPNPNPGIVLIDFEYKYIYIYVYIYIYTPTYIHARICMWLTSHRVPLTSNHDGTIVKNKDKEFLLHYSDGNSGIITEVTKALAVTTCGAESDMIGFDNDILVSESIVEGSTKPSDV
jgi:hypothetical protein